jgi:hypothetical protein
MTTLQLSDQKLSIGKQVETYIFEAMVNCWNGDVRVVLVFKQLAVGESEVPLVLSIMQCRKVEAGATEILVEHWRTLSQPRQASSQ